MQSTLNLYNQTRVWSCEVHNKGIKQGNNHENEKAPIYNGKGKAHQIRRNAI